MALLGASPVESETALRQMVFVREDQTYPDIKVRQAVQVASWFYPNWNHDLAGALLEEFNAVARFFTTLTIEGLTGLLAALTVALLAGGYATVRRLAV